MTFIPFMLGCTCYEAQFGRLGIRFLRPKMWCRRMNFPLTVYWTDKEGNIVERKPGQRARWGSAEVRILLTLFLILVPITCLIIFHPKASPVAYWFLGFWMNDVIWQVAGIRRRNYIRSNW